MINKMLLTIVLVLVTQVASALQVPVSKMQNAVSGVTQQKMQSEGFTPRDTRYNAALVSVGVGAASYAAQSIAVVALGVTAPAWISVAIGLAAGGAALFLLTDGVKWISKDGSHVQVGDNPASVNTPAGLPVPSVMYCMTGACSSSATGACEATPYKSGTSGDLTWTAKYEMRGNQCFQVLTYSNGYVTGGGLWGTPEKFINNNSICPGISLSASSGVCPASNFPEATPAPVKTISDAADALTAPQKAAPLNPQIVADLANDLWREAATKPGYDGLPYDATKPITAVEAATWQSANSTSWPSVGDFVAPQAAPSGGTASTPFTMPMSQTPVTTADPATNPSTGTNPSTEPLENLGSDPGIGTPALEPIPTAQQILSPLLNLFPTLRSFVVPSHNATCPKWSVHLFDRDVQLQDHCPMLEQARPTAQATMAAVWILIALFIVLAA